MSVNEWLTDVQCRWEPLWRKAVRDGDSATVDEMCKEFVEFCTNLKDLSDINILDMDDDSVFAIVTTLLTFGNHFARSVIRTPDILLKLSTRLLIVLSAQAATGIAKCKAQECSLSLDDSLRREVVATRKNLYQTCLNLHKLLTLLADRANARLTVLQTNMQITSRDILLEACVKYNSSQNVNFAEIQRIADGILEDQRVSAEKIVKRFQNTFNTASATCSNSCIDSSMKLFESWQDWRPERVQPILHGCVCQRRESGARPEATDCKHPPLLLEERLL
jgi:hypothetical protein